MSNYSLNRRSNWEEAKCKVISFMKKNFKMSDCPICSALLGISYSNGGSIHAFCYEHKNNKFEIDINFASDNGIIKLHFDNLTVQINKCNIKELNKTIISTDDEKQYLGEYQSNDILGYTAEPYLTKLNITDS